MAGLERALSGARAASSIERAAQEIVSALVQAFAGSIVLARIFATLPFRRVPGDVRESVRNQASRADQALTEDTPVLTLLATSGEEAAWRDRRLSRGHAGIPLTSSAFIGLIPMMARLMEEVGIDLKWFDQGDRNAFVNKGVYKSGEFYVDDARTAVDGLGRKVISAQDFVSAQRIRTVFGAGASYLGTSTMMALICFTRESLDRASSQQALVLMHRFCAETFGLSLSGRIFS